MTAGTNTRPIKGFGQARKLLTAAFLLTGLRVKRVYTLDPDAAAALILR